MMFIHNDNPKVGDWLYTNKEHSSLDGRVRIGSYVMVTAIGPRGYDIEDECGNTMTEIGWII